MIKFLIKTRNDVNVVEMCLDFCKTVDGNMMKKLTELEKRAANYDTVYKIQDSDSNIIDPQTLTYLSTTYNAKENFKDTKIIYMRLAAPGKPSIWAIIGLEDTMDGEVLRYFWSFANIYLVSCPQSDEKEFVKSLKDQCGSFGYDIVPANTLETYEEHNTEWTVDFSDEMYTESSSSEQVKPVKTARPWSKSPTAEPGDKVSRFLEAFKNANLEDKVKLAVTIVNYMNDKFILPDSLREDLSLTLIIDSHPDYNMTFKLDNDKVIFIEDFTYMGDNLDRVCTSRTLELSKFGEATLNKILDNTPVYNYLCNHQCVQLSVNPTDRYAIHIVPDYPYVVSFDKEDAVEAIAFAISEAIKSKKGQVSDIQSMELYVCDMKRVGLDGRPQRVVKFDLDILKLPLNSGKDVQDYKMYISSIKNSSIMKLIERLE